MELVFESTVALPLPLPTKETPEIVIASSASTVRLPVKAEKKKVNVAAATTLLLSICTVSQFEVTSRLRLATRALLPLMRIGPSEVTEPLPTGPPLVWAHRQVPLMVT